jgi:hypothetical protein
MAITKKPKIRLVYDPKTDTLKAFAGSKQIVPPDNTDDILEELQRLNEFITTGYAAWDVRWTFKKGVSFAIAYKKDTRLPVVPAKQCS